MKNYTKLSGSQILRFSLSLFICLALLSGVFGPAQAAPTYPIYIVESGDTLYDIAWRFSTTVEELIQVNQLDAGGNLHPGDRLRIPSFAGMSGLLALEYVPLGASLTSLSRRSQASPADLIRANKLTSPSELFIGRQLIVSKPDGTQSLETMPSLQAGQSLLEVALLSGQNPWTLVRLNRLASPNNALPQDSYYRPSENAETGSLAIPGVRSIELQGLPLKQGETFYIKVLSDQNVKIQSTLAGITSQFTRNEEGQIAFGGINALTEPGVYPLNMEIETENGATYRFDQYVIIQSGNYSHDGALKVDPQTIDDANGREENARFKALTATITPVQQWQGQFVSPAQDPDCITSYFGSRRTYNDDPRLFYHTGLDLGYCKGTEVYSPAVGTVIAALPDQIVRGNSIIIDHGLGVYTIYFHLASILVHEGDIVHPGQQIGVIGTTGRSTGPHLHFEVSVQGTPVNPLTWLERVFP